MAIFLFMNNLHSFVYLRFTEKVESDSSILTAKQILGCLQGFLEFQGGLVGLFMEWGARVLDHRRNEARFFKWARYVMRG